MSIELKDLHPFSQAPAHIPGRPHLSTLHRWRLSGVRGIKLETVVVGGRRYVSEEAIQQFIEQTTAAANGEAPAGRTVRQRQRAFEKADAELRAAGIGSDPAQLISTSRSPLLRHRTREGAQVLAPRASAAGAAARKR